MKLYNIVSTMFHIITNITTKALKSNLEYRQILTWGNMTNNKSNYFRVM